MKNINLELIQKGKKLLLQRVAPFALTATIVASMGTMNAQAANVTIDNVTINSEGYVTETEYKSNWLDNSEEYNVNVLIERINTDYENVYDVIANGGLSLMNTTPDASQARILAFVNQINDKYATELSKLDSNGKTVIEKYLTSKANEAKVVYSSIVGITVKDLNKYSEGKQCIFGTDLNGNIVNNSVFVFQKVGNDYKTTATYSYNNVNNNYKLIVVPSLNVTNSNSTSFKANMSYKGVVVARDSYASYSAIITEAEKLFNKVEYAYTKGNYTKKNGVSIEQVYTMIYGDTNLVINSLNTKYTDSNARASIKDYLDYRQQDLLAKVAKNNSLTYDNMRNNSSTIVRQYENGGLVVYGLSNGSTSAVNNQGFITTSELSATGQGITNPGLPSNELQTININASTGINIKYNDTYYFPTDANGNKVDALVYNGTTYLPVRAICNIYGANVNWNSYINTVEITSGTKKFEYNGYSWYVDDIKTLFRPGTPSTQLTNKNMSVQIGAKIVFDGRQITPTDVNGKVVPVISYNGTTYLPVRAMVNANMFNDKIEYDSKTNTVYLGGHYIIDQPIIPEVPTIKPEEPGNGGITVGDSWFDAMDTQTGTWVRIYKDSQGMRYLIENGSKRYLTPDEIINRYQPKGATYSTTNNVSEKQYTKTM